MSDDRNWRGSAAELAALAAERLGGLGFEDDKLNERLVRYYVSEHVLSRPRREGREAVFGYRQLLELLAARLLSRDGWPLAKIASWNQGADERALRDLIPERKPVQDAPQRTEYLSDSGAVSVAGEFTERLIAAHQRPAFESESMVRVRVPGVLELLLPAAEACSMTGEKAEHYARIVRDVLRGMKPTNG